MFVSLLAGIRGKFRYYEVRWNTRIFYVIIETVYSAVCTFSSPIVHNKPLAHSLPGATRMRLSHQGLSRNINPEIPHSTTQRTMTDTTEDPGVLRWTVGFVMVGMAW